MRIPPVPGPAVLVALLCVGCGSSNTATDGGVGNDAGQDAGSGCPGSTGACVSCGVAGQGSLQVCTDGPSYQCTEAQDGQCKEGDAAIPIVAGATFCPFAGACPSGEIGHCSVAATNTVIHYYTSTACTAAKPGGSASCAAASGTLTGCP